MLLIPSCDSNGFKRCIHFRSFLILSYFILITNATDKDGPHHAYRRANLRNFLDDRSLDTKSNDTTTIESGTNASALMTAVTCIGDDASFRKAVSTATSSSDLSKPATVITLCDRVKIANIKNPKYYNVTGIDVSNKKIELICIKKSGGRCVIDGQRKSRILYGSNSMVRVTNFDLINSYVGEGDVYSEGTIASFTNRSVVSFNQCSFRNNIGRGYGRGGISMIHSTLTLRGTIASPMIFSNNYQFSASSLYLVDSKFNAVTGNVYFVNNTAGYIGAIRLINSTGASMKGIIFQNNSGEDNGAILAEDCKSSTVYLENIQFLNNRGYEYNSALSLRKCNAIIKGVTFANNLAWWRGALTVSMSNVTLTNCTFRNNTVWEGSGADIYIADDSELDPKKGGSFVSCNASTTTTTGGEGSVVFCNGVGKRSIQDSIPYKNTNCMEKGITRSCRV